MRLLPKGNVRQQLKATLQGDARKGKINERSKNLDVHHDSIRTSKKKGKSDNGKIYILTVVLFKRKKVRVVQILLTSNQSVKVRTRPNFVKQNIKCRRKRKKAPCDIKQNIKIKF